jgi:hypothetical protein
MEGKGTISHEAPKDRQPIYTGNLSRQAKLQSAAWMRTLPGQPTTTIFEFLQLKCFCLPFEWDNGADKLWDTMREETKLCQ